MKTFKTEIQDKPLSATHYRNECEHYEFSWVKFTNESMYVWDETYWDEVEDDDFESTVKPIPQEENQMNIDKVETQTPEEKEALDNINPKTAQCGFSVEKALAAIAELDKFNDASKLRKTPLHRAIETQTEHQEEMSAFSGENEWNGEGLPPVGVWFEISANMANTVWNKCRVIHYHGNLAWLEFECNAIMNMIKNLNNNVIRPTETKQQREDRERLEAAYDLYVTHEDYIDNPVCSISIFSESNEPKNKWLAIVEKTNYRKGVK